MKMAEMAGRKSAALAKLTLRLKQKRGKAGIDATADQALLDDYNRQINEMERQLKPLVETMEARKKMRDDLMAQLDLAKTQLGESLGGQERDIAKVRGVFKSIQRKAAADSLMLNKGFGTDKTTTFGITQYREKAETQRSADKEKAKREKEDTISGAEYPIPMGKLPSVS